MNKPETFTNSPIERQVLETSRLWLCEVNGENYRALFNQYSQEQIMSYLFLLDEEGYLKEKEKFDKGVVTHHRSFDQFFMVEKESGQCIGAVGFHTWYIQHHRAEIGYAITDENYKNRGYMKEAMREVLRYGFGEMQLNRVEAFIGVNNEPSLKLIRSFGFIKEGTLRQHYFKGGTIEDSEVWGLLREDFEMKEMNY